MRIKQCDLVVTENCCLRCKMCHIWKHKRDDEQVLLDEYLCFFDSLRDFSREPVQIQFVGGEPLLKKGLLDLIGYASGKGFSTTMTTNGFLVDRNAVEMLRKCGLQTLGFSLESMKKEKHDFLRGTDGAYERVMKALEYFSEYHSPDIFIATIINGQNLDDLAELAEWVNVNRRLDFIYFQAVMQPFGTKENEEWFKDEEFKFLWPDADKASEVLDKLIHLKSSSYKINNQLAQLESFKSYFRDPGTFIKKRTKCNLGKDAVTVLPDGNIFLCLAMEPIGNIKADRIEDAWSSEKAERVRGKIANCRNNCKLMINCFFEEEKKECQVLDA